MKNLKNYRLSILLCLLAFFLNKNTVKAQMGCPYTITNGTNFDLIVHWEVVGSTCLFTCWSGGSGTIIPKNSTLNIPCCELDIFVDVTDYYDSSTSSWLPVVVQQSNSVNGTTLTTCSAVANSSETGDIDGATPITIQWFSTNTQIQ